MTFVLELEYIYDLMIYIPSSDVYKRVRSHTWLNEIVTARSKSTILYMNNKNT